MRNSFYFYYLNDTAFSMLVFQHRGLGMKEENPRGCREGTKNEKREMEEFTFFTLWFPTLSSSGNNWALEERGKQTKKGNEKKGIKRRIGEIWNEGKRNVEDISKNARQIDARLEVKRTKFNKR